MYKVDDVRVGRWDHVKTFWNTGKTSILFDCNSVSFSFGILSLKSALRTSLVAQWLRIRLPVQGTRVQSLVREDPTCTEQLSPCTTTTEPVL